MEHKTDLDALDRMVAEAEAAPILWASRAAFLWNAYPALAAELREALEKAEHYEAEAGQLSARLYETQKQIAELEAELEDETEALNEATRQYIELKSSLAARDRRMKRLGAAEELRKMASGSRSRSIELCDAFATGVRAEQQAWIRELNERAAELEAAGEGEEANGN